MGSNPLVNTCCQPYNQANGGNIVGTCAATNNLSQLPLNSTAGAGGGVVTSAAAGTAYLACPNPPVSGSTCNKQSVAMSSYPVGAQFASNNTQRMQAIMNEISTNGPVMACFNV